MAGEQDTMAAAAASRGRTLDELRAPLQRWAAEHLGPPGAELVGLTHPTGAGTSSETVLANLRWTERGTSMERGVVFRFRPAGFQLYFEPDFRRQYDTLAAVHSLGVVPVPEPLTFESDPEIAGLPFFVMERIDSQVPVGNPHFASEGFLVDATSDERRRAWESAVGHLARVATAPSESLGFLARPAYGPTGLAEDIGYWERAARWACDEEVPSWLGDLLAWLQGNVPETSLGLSWGDARLGNVGFGADLSVRVLYDWEQATLSDPRQDLGWWLLFDRYQVEGLGLPRLDGFGDRAETIAAWEHGSGRPADDLNWFEAFAATKLSIIGIRALLLQGAELARSANGSPVPRLAFDYAGLPQPGAGS